jgi:hypothetical protein
MRNPISFTRISRRPAAGLLAIFALAVAALAAPASAATRFDVHVPFAFQAGRAALPAGDYSVERQGTGVLVLRNVATDDAAILVTAPLDVDGASQQPALVFNRYASGGAFLAQVRSFDGTQTFKIAPSKSERQLAVAGAAPTVVAVVTTR